MIKINEEKMEPIERKSNILRTWVSNSNELMKVWEDKSFRLYEPWITINKSMYGNKYPALMTTQGNTIENLFKYIDDSNKLFVSWINEFGENSRKTAEALNDVKDPAKIKDCFDNWVKTYQKVADDMLEHPAVKYQNKLIENFTGIPDFYSDSFAMIAKQWKELFAKLNQPSEEYMQKINEIISKMSKGESTPETYKEFVDTCINQYNRKCV